MGWYWRMMSRKINKAASLKYSEIQIGSTYSFERIVSQQDGQSFARLTGDYNPLHVDYDFAKKSQFKRNIVHGMMVAALFSTLVGMYCPGEYCLYISQTIKFKSPIFYGDTVSVRGTVINKSDSIKMITLKTEILKGDEIALTGEAMVKIMEK